MGELDVAQVDAIRAFDVGAEFADQVAGVEAEAFQVGAVVVDDLRHELVVAGEPAQVGLEQAEGVSCQNAVDRYAVAHL